MYKGYRAKPGEDSSKVDPNSVKGWDFINNDADPMETTYTEWQQSGAPEFDDRGSSFYTAHGTHVAGIVSAQKKNTSDSAVKVLHLTLNCITIVYSVHTEAEIVLVLLLQSINLFLTA